MDTVPNKSGTGKKIPRPYSDDDTKRFHPINGSYTLAIDTLRHNNMVKASRRLTDYADVFQRLYHVFADIIEAERHATGRDPYWTEPLNQAAELMGNAVTRMGEQIASAVGMTGLSEETDPLQKLANLPALILTHEEPANLIVQFTDQDVSHARGLVDDDRPSKTVATLTAMRDRYATMLNRFQVFFSDICDLAEAADTGFYAVDDLAAYRLWRVAWELEKSLHSYHHSIICNIGSLTAAQPQSIQPQKGGAK